VSEDDLRRTRGAETYAAQFDVTNEEAEGFLVSGFGQRFAEEALRATGGGAWHGGSLELKYRGLVVIGILAALGGVEERMQGHVQWALRNGATREDIETVMLLVANYAGFARASVALEGVMSLLEDSPE
jgi:4-carboxymuconolactone decarboxylase